MTEPSPALADDTLIYAVGDIHGRADLLKALHRRILDHARRRAEQRQVIVFLGDYVDRGAGSREVIDFLIDAAACDDGIERVFLKGNHDDAMLAFLDGTDDGTWWISMLGGRETLASYGIDIASLPRIPSRRRHELREKLPAGHARFLSSLRLFHVEEGCLFVHAGIRPGRSLDRQDPEDLLWIREEFLESDADFGRLVIHGHTICWDGPEVRANRIGIDTGAFATGVLTALVLAGDGLDILQT